MYIILYKANNIKDENIFRTFKKYHKNKKLLIY